MANDVNRDVAIRLTGSLRPEGFAAARGALQNLGLSIRDRIYGRSQVRPDTERGSKQQQYVSQASWQNRQCRHARRVSAR